MLSIQYDNYTYTIRDIENLPNLYRVIDPISYDLEYDVFNFTVKSNAIGEEKLKEKYGLWLATVSDEGIVVDNGNFEDFVYGGQVKLYENGTLKALMYVTDVTPVNKRHDKDELFHVKCVSAIGILSRVEHLGGLYVGTTAGAIISDIMGALPYTIDSDLSAQKLYGWLPYVNDARQNLNKVLFATGAMVTRNLQGNVHFTYNQQDVAKIVPKNRTFYGGINSKKEHKSSVTVIEHSYYESTEVEEELVFDNTDGVAGNNTRITFDEPYYDYRGDGLTVVSSSANWAIITGVGYLYAKKYVHTQRPVSATIDSSGQPEVLQVSDQTLVSSLNVNGIVDRLTNYYENAKIRTFDIEVKNEKPGDLIEFYDRRDRVNTGYIKSIDESASSFWRGTVNAVTEWMPTKGGNDYRNYLIVTNSNLSSGTWTVPSALRGKRARIVLFSGAQGGQGGYAGQTAGEVHGGTRNMNRFFPEGADARNEYYLGGLQDGVQAGGKGGKGGKGGASATRMINIDVESLANSYPVTFGAGGAGGAGGTVVRDYKNDVTVTQPQNGSQGGDSVFNGFSTQSGALFEGTYVNMITGQILVQEGQDGSSGGNGGAGGYSELIHGPYSTFAQASAYTYNIANAKGKKGTGIGGYTGGTGANGRAGMIDYGYYYQLSDDLKYYVIGSGGGGGGGGGAMGANGGNGETAYTSSIRESGTRDTFYYTNYLQVDNTRLEGTHNGAWGGDGADVTIIPAKPAYVGGSGGHGGGGGGGAGQCLSSLVEYLDSGKDEHYGYACGGKGGNGGRGGDGSDGFMIVYY